MNIFYSDNNNNKNNLNNYQESIQRIVNQRNSLFKEIENKINKQYENGKNETIIKSIELIIQIEERIKKIKELNSLQSNLLEYISPSNPMVPTSPFSSPILNSGQISPIIAYSNLEIDQSPTKQPPKKQNLQTKSIPSNKDTPTENNIYEKDEKEEKEKEEKEKEKEEKEELIKPNKPKRGRPLKPKPEHCFRCGTRSCPYWRKNVIKGEVVDVCNACGLHLMKKEKKDLEEKRKNSIKNLLNNDESLTNYDDLRFRQQNNKDTNHRGTRKSNQPQKENNNKPRKIQQEPELTSHANHFTGSPPKYTKH
ncbi:hypothetical protein ACTA71_002952 [Dictyostelium dimigraforme]